MFTGLLLDTESIEGTLRGKAVEVKGRLKEASCRRGCGDLGVKGWARRAVLGGEESELVNVLVLTVRGINVPCGSTLVRGNESCKKNIKMKVFEMKI